MNKYKERKFRQHCKYRKKITKKKQVLTCCVRNPQPAFPDVRGEPHHKLWVITINITEVRVSVIRIIPPA